MKNFLLLSGLTLAVLTWSCNPPESGTPPASGQNPVESEASDPGSEPSPEAEVAKKAAPMSKKKELLTSLVGEYQLESISGAMGANTMVDYNLVEGKWAASGSSNNGGMREGYNIELTEKDLNKLATATIKVAEDLTVTYSCAGKPYFTLPYKENGLEFRLSKSLEDYILGVPKGLTPNSTILEGDLYLLAKDGIAADELKEIDMLEVGADAAVLSYNLQAKEFELTLFYADCCDNSVYTFR
jgi:hypothetical protein